PSWLTLLHCPDPPAAARSGLRGRLLPREGAIIAPHVVVAQRGHPGRPCVRAQVTAWGHRHQAPAEGTAHLLPRPAGRPRVARGGGGGGGAPRPASPIRGSWGPGFTATRLPGQLLNVLSLLVEEHRHPRGGELGSRQLDLEGAVSADLELDHLRSDDPRGAWVYSDALADPGDRPAWQGRSPPLLISRRPLLSLRGRRWSTSTSQGLAHRLPPLPPVVALVLVQLAGHLLHLEERGR